MTNSGHTHFSYHFEERASGKSVILSQFSNWRENPLRFQTAILPASTLYAPIENRKIQKYSRRAQLPVRAGRDRPSMWYTVGGIRTGCRRKRREGALCQELCSFPTFRIDRLYKNVSRPGIFSGCGRPRRCRWAWPHGRSCRGSGTAECRRNTRPPSWR